MTNSTLDKPTSISLRDHERGLLAIDVDGPLNPFGAKPCRRPVGYTSYRLTDDDRWFTGRDFRKAKGLCVWLNADHGQQILDLAAQARLRPVWATTWLHRANTFIAPAIGLPALPVITFPETDLQPVGNHHLWQPEGDWKWTGVAASAPGIPLAWLDDQFDDPDWRAGKKKFLDTRGAVPTLLCHVDPATGLLDQHYDQVRNWAAALPD